MKAEALDHLARKSEALATYRMAIEKLQQDTGVTEKDRKVFLQKLKAAVARDRQ